MHKRWVIPDIHGCSRTLKHLFREKIKPSRFDALYFLGDYIDRGPDSKGVIDFLMHLNHEGYNLFLLKGNHEDVFLKAWEAEMQLKKSLLKRQKNPSKEEWLNFGGKETMKSFGTTDLKAIPEKYIRWVHELKLFFALEDYIIVHAGLNFELEDPFRDERSMMWIRDYKIIPERIGNRKIVHGHVPLSFEFIKETLYNPAYSFIDVDNGCYAKEREGFGNLLALELNSMELKIQRNID